VANTKEGVGGQKPAEGLLSGSIALFEQMGNQTKSAEGRVELACCYFWQGLFDLALASLRSSLETLPETETELRSVALIRLALVEHHAGRLHDALGLLNQAAPLVEGARPWIKGRFHL